MLKHYSTPNMNRIINFEPKGEKCVFIDGRFATENEDTQRLLESHPQFGIQFFCDEYASVAKENDRQELKSAVVDDLRLLNKELIEEVKRLRAELEVAKADDNDDEDDGLYDSEGRSPFPEDGKCQEITKAGKRCRLNATVFVRGKWVCPTHEQAAAKISLN